MLQDNTKEALEKLNEYENYLLEKVGIYVKGKVKENLKKGKPHRNGKSYPIYDTGNLINSITYKVGKKLVRIGTPLEYAIYIEKGAKHHWTSVKNLIEWVRRKFPTLSNKEQNSISYAIQKTIAKDDMPAMPFITPAVEENLRDIKTILDNKKYGVNYGTE